TPPLRAPSTKAAITRKVSPPSNSTSKTRSASPPLVGAFSASAPPIQPASRSRRIPIARPAIPNTAPSTTPSSSSTRPCCPLPKPKALSNPPAGSTEPQSALSPLLNDADHHWHPAVLCVPPYLSVSASKSQPLPFHFPLANHTLPYRIQNQFRLVV